MKNGSTINVTPDPIDPLKGSMSPEEIERLNATAESTEDADFETPDEKFGGDFAKDKFEARPSKSPSAQQPLPAPKGLVKLKNLNSDLERIHNLFLSIGVKHEVVKNTMMRNDGMNWTPSFGDGSLLVMPARFQDRPTFHMEFDKQGNLLK